jgi:hypothetical protein
VSAVISQPLTFDVDEWGAVVVAGSQCEVELVRASTRHDEAQGDREDNENR